MAKDDEIIVKIDENMMDYFLQAYSPVEDIEDADELFSDSDLRNILNAHARHGEIDLLPYAKDKLRENGYKWHHIGCMPVCMAMRRTRKQKTKDLVDFLPTLPPGIDEDIIIKSIEWDKNCIDDDDDEEEDVEYLSD